MCRTENVYLENCIYIIMLDGRCAMVKFVTTVRHMGQQTCKRWPTDPDK